MQKIIINDLDQDDLDIKLLIIENKLRNIRELFLSMEEVLDLVEVI